MMELNEKELLFCNEYLTDFNGTRSAIACGYSKASARQIAYRMLRKAHIKKYLEEAMAETFAKLETERERVMSEIASIAFDDISNYLEIKEVDKKIGVNENGEPITTKETVVKLKDSKNIDTKNIAELSVGKDGQIKFKLYPRDNALYKLAEIMGIGKENNDMNVNVNIVEDI